METKARELARSREDRPVAEVPESGRESSVKVTKSDEDLDLGGSLKDQPNPPPSDDCGKPGEPSPSFQTRQDTGIDCTRDPDWAVVEPDELPEKPLPEQTHNDKYWDERSLDSQLQETDLQEELIRRELDDFSRASQVADEAGRSFQNETLDPYYGGGKKPSGSSPSANSLDPSL